MIIESRPQWTHPISPYSLCHSLSGLIKRWCVEDDMKDSRIVHDPVYVACRSCHSVLYWSSRVVSEPYEDTLLFARLNRRIILASGQPPSSIAVRG